MLTRRDEVKLMDFGISRILWTKEEKNKPATFQGTPLYMSPEQAGSGETVDQQSDILSLGVVMYELLSGKKPFFGNNVAELIHRIIRVEPVPISKHLPDVSIDLEQIVYRAMEKKKSDRYGSALELAEALLPFIKGEDSVQLDKQDKKKIAYLKRLPFFKHFQYSELMEAIRISSWSFQDRQTRIIREDENDNTIYFLVQGKARLHIRGKMKVLEPGECFGETAVLYKMPRKAAVMAETNCIVMAINANLLKQASEKLQVKFLREFYNKKIMQLVDVNLTMIRAGR